ncbi:MAG: heat shock protein HspQ [Alphaproteobacteria bacterium]
MTSRRAAFRIGQLVHHKLFDYRGVVIDVDPEFSASQTWYEVMARSRPPKDRPWYHVLVHDATHRTYVAERNLEADETGEPIRHPELGEHFAELRDGVYRVSRAAN